MQRSGDMDWPTETAQKRVSQFAKALRSFDDGQANVPNLSWTVADLGQHVACLPSYWRKLHEAGAGFVLPDDFAAFSDAARAHITETDPARLADLLESEFDGYLRWLADADGLFLLYGVEVTATNTCGLIINETILHGRDLASVNGTTAPMYERDEALVVVDAVMATTSCFVDPVKAKAQKDGVYHVRFRGGKDFTWTKQGGELVIEEGIPPKADAHLNTDPAMFLLSSLNRVGQVQAALSGKMISYGRRPWRFLGLAKMVADGV